MKKEGQDRGMLPVDQADDTQIGSQDASGATRGSLQKV